MDKLTKKQEIRVSEKQKETLTLLHKKYGVNSSQFIRDAINEKLTRDKETLFKNYKDLQRIIAEINTCPF